MMAAANPIRKSNRRSLPNRSRLILTCDVERLLPAEIGRAREGGTMATITTKDGTEIFFKDWGTGQPLVFHHGWPLSADDWDAQMMFFLEKGYRVIAHDRRGHGRSTQTVTGNE